MKIYFFYSSKGCQHSAHMWQVMEKEGILSWFEKMNIDNFSLDQLMQFGMKEVPAILVVGNNNKRELAEGKPAFKWLEQKIQNRRNNMSMMANSNRQKILERNMMVNNNDGVTNFSKSEMSGASDDYAYLLTDLAQSKSYVGYGQDNQAIMTMLEGKKVTEAETTAAMQKEQAHRDKEKETMKEGMKQGQIEAIYDHRMMK